MRSRTIYNIIVLIVVASALIVFSIQYQFLTRPYFPEPSLPYLWIRFMNNVTEVKTLDTVLTADSFSFTINFIASGNDLLLDVTTNGMNDDDSCDIYLIEHPVDSEETQTWNVQNNNNSRLHIQGNVTKTNLELKGDCDLENFIPKGHLDINVRNVTEDSLIINKIVSTVSFDISKFGCSGDCVYNEKLSLIHYPVLDNAQSFIMEGENINAYYLRTNFSTFDNQKKLRQSLFRR